MAATTESVKADAAEAPLLNKRNLILGSLVYIVFLRLGPLVRRCLWLVSRS
jgi:hypothetical protein